MFYPSFQKKFIQVVIKLSMEQTDIWTDKVATIFFLERPSERHFEGVMGEEVRSRVDAKVIATLMLCNISESILKNKVKSSHPFFLTFIFNYAVFAESYLEGVRVCTDTFKFSSSHIGIAMHRPGTNTT